MKKMACTLALAAAALLPAAALATPRSGQFSLGGIQQVCISFPGNFWYYTTFSSGGGQIFGDGVADDGRIYLYGNYATPADTYKAVGNDSILIKAGNIGHWVEWRDFFTSFNFLDDFKFTFVKAVCDPPASRISKPGATDPMKK